MEDTEVGLMEGSPGGAPVLQQENRQGLEALILDWCCFYQELSSWGVPARQVIRHGREDSKVLMPNVSLHSQDKWALKGGTQAPMSGKPRPNTTEKGTALLSSLNISRQHGAYAKLTQRTETWLLEQ